MHHLIDRIVNATLLATATTGLFVITTGCSGDSCTLDRDTNAFTIDFTTPISNYEGTVETGDVWLRSHRRLSPNGTENNTVLLLAESAASETVVVSCVDGQLSQGEEFFHQDCANGLKWADGSFIPLHFRVAMTTAFGDTFTPEDGMVAYEPQEVGQGAGDCYQPTMTGSVVVETDSL